jgi:hypothetical protein
MTDAIADRHVALAFDRRGAAPSLGGADVVAPPTCM